jgi:hypothetical protein
MNELSRGMRRINIGAKPLSIGANTLRAVLPIRYNDDEIGSELTVNNVTAILQHLQKLFPTRYSQWFTMNRIYSLEIPNQYTESTLLFSKDGIRLAFTVSSPDEMSVMLQTHTLTEICTVPVPTITNIFPRVREVVETVIGGEQDSETLHNKFHDELMASATNAMLFPLGTLS